MISSPDVSTILSRVFESSHDAVIGEDHQGTITSWNLAAEKIFGFSPAEAVGNKITLISPERLRQRQANDPGNFQCEEENYFEDVCQRKNGMPFPASITLLPVKATGDNTGGYFKIIRDISERKALEKKQWLLSSIIDSSEDAIVSKNLDGIITSWNSAAEIIFGYTAEEVIGKHISIIIPPDRIEEEAMIIEQIRKGERISHFETTRITKDGRRKDVSLTVSPVRDAQGTITGASKIGRDITQRKLLEKSQALFAAIVDSSDDAIISKNLDGIITSWNRGAQAIFGYTAEEVIGKHISIIIPPSKLDEETMIIGKIRRGEPINHFETTRITKDGKEKAISLTVSPVKDARGKIEGASKIARDITDKIELEKQKSLYTTRLQDLNKYKDEFMAMASHELKTPLTVSKANLQVLGYVIKEEQQVALLDKAITQLDKMSSLIGHLLDVSKVQAGVVELNLMDFDICALVSEVVNNIQLTNESHKITLQKQDEALLIHADRDRIEQVIVNLLTNAIKYSPNVGDVCVSIALDEDQVIFRVTDYGIGISGDDIKMLFTRFFRAPGVGAIFSGSGIGLYISNEIVKRHGGKMWVDSKIGEGSSFYFSLPSATSQSLQHPELKMQSVESK